MIGPGLADLAEAVRGARGMAHKTDIADAVAALGLDAAAVVPVGDDCAAIPDGDGWLLFAIEGFVEDFVESDPRFAGWCGIMVNLSDIAAMGGRPIAVVDAIWAKDREGAEPVLAGLRDASRAYGVPVVGGHTNHRAGAGSLAVAVLGRAERLITSFGARPGDVLVAAVDLRGGFRGTSLNWDAASGAPGARLRGDLALLADLAEAGLVRAGKDISMAGLVGTAIMLCEASGCGACIDVAAVPCPAGVDLARFLLAFPSFGFVLSVAPVAVGAVLTRFAARDIACAAVGAVDDSRAVRLWRDGEEAPVWDLQRPFIGCGAAAQSAGADAFARGA